MEESDQQQQQQQKPHAIMISYPLQGHIIPLVHLAVKLASKGFTVTFVHAEAIHQTIAQSHNDNDGTNTTHSNDIFADARRSDLDLRYTTIDDGLPLEFDRTLDNEKYWNYILDIFPDRVDDFVGNMLRSDPSSAFFLVADTFYSWTSMISGKYNLVNVSFWTQPALAFTLNYHVDLLIKNGHFLSKDNRKDNIDYIPGVHTLEPKDLMSFLQTSDASTVVHRIGFRAFEEVDNANFILFNTVQELESEVISALDQKLPVYTIGPIFHTGFSNRIVSMSLWGESDCLSWLNTKAHGSVLYVSFGSLAHLTKQDLLEIAHGLLGAGVSFIWVLRPGTVSSGETEILPFGFEDHVKDRGLIVPWCCQMDVISHPAVGGFLTHCGWNSLLESIWHGVPLICFPFLFDQLPNRKLVVDDWKIGINLCDNKSITRAEVTEKINRLMSGKSSDDLKNEIKRVRSILKSALATNGSSDKNFGQFIKDVKVEIQKRIEVKKKSDM